MRLYLLRHGQTDWNAANRIQGHADIPLNPTGVKQAEAVRDDILAQDLKFDAIYVAPFQRTQRTAEIVADGQDIIYSDLIKERNVGDFEGQPCGTLFDNEIDYLDPELNAGDRGVEPIRDFEGRAREFLAMLRSNYPADARILVVTSNGFMKRTHVVITGDNHPPNFKNATLYRYDL